MIFNLIVIPLDSYYITEYIKTYLNIVVSIIKKKKTS